jgi:hypothetical protein
MLEVSPPIFSSRAPLRCAAAQRRPVANNFLKLLKTDVPETINEMINSVRKRGRCGLTAAYSALANGVNVGS